MRVGDDPRRARAVHRGEVGAHEVEHIGDAAVNVRLAVEDEVVHEPVVERVVERRARVGVRGDARVPHLVLTKVGRLFMISWAGLHRESRRVHARAGHEEVAVGRVAAVEVISPITCVEREVKRARGRVVGDLVEPESIIRAKVRPHGDALRRAGRRRGAGDKGHVRRRRDGAVAARIKVRRAGLEADEERVRHVAHCGNERRRRGRRRREGSRRLAVCA